MPPTPRAVFVRTAVYAMAILWPLVAIMSGVGNEFQRVPLPKKVALCASALIISTALFILPAKRHYGWAVAFMLIAMQMIGVMWFWN